MNRTQYEAIHGSQVKINSCPVCKTAKDIRSMVALKKHRARKNKLIAMNNAIAEGKVIVLYEKDEFTGLHYQPSEDFNNVIWD